MKRATEKLLEYARDLADAMEARAIVFNADVFPVAEGVECFSARPATAEIVLVTRNPDFHPPCPARVLKAPDIDLTRLGQIKMATLLGFAQGLFRKGDRLVCLTGLAGTGMLDTIVFTEVGAEFEMFAANGADDLSDHVHTEVFERVLEIAASLANEGREGKPVGAIFVMGDTPRVIASSEQLVLNPFKGYPEESRNILDPALEETVKEFSTIDGAFLIREDGVIEAAGAYLRTGAATVELPHGLGARHKSAAAITVITRAVAITVSESTGNVTVFRGGKILIEIDKPRPQPERPSFGVQ